MVLYLTLFPLVAYILNFRIKNIKDAYRNKKNLKSEIFLLSITSLIIFSIIYFIELKF
jgi:hypothetical protein